MLGIGIVFNFISFLTASPTLMTWSQEEEAVVVVGNVLVRIGGCGDDDAHDDDD